MLTSIALVALLALAPLQDAKPSASAPVAKKPSAASFERLKTMKGSWDADLDGDGAADTVVDYRIVGSGSAVVETLFPGTEHEMVTVYHLNGDELLCTHYCAAGNQPRLRAKKISDASIEFVMKDITNLSDPKAMHMNALIFTFADDGSVRAVWSSVADGKPGHTADFRMTRKK